MRARWFSLGLVLGVVGALSLGFGFASAGPETTAGPAGRTSTSGWIDAMDAMHDSPAMQQMHEQMPEQLQAQCDAMHEQMESTMAQGQMGPGMMDGSAAHDAHHPEGYVPGAGGMMGRSPGMMGGSSGMMGI